MESQEDFDKRKSIYIQQKTVLTDRLQHLVNEQNKVLDEIAALKKPTIKPPTEFGWLPRGTQEDIRRILMEGEEGECDFVLDKSEATIKDGWTNGKIILKTDTKWTKSIEWLLVDSREILDEHQSYLINRLIRPNYKTEEQIEREKKRKPYGSDIRDSDDESW